MYLCPSAEEKRWVKTGRCGRLSGERGSFHSSGAAAERARPPLRVDLVLAPSGAADLREGVKRCDGSER
ncbi:hypothetical protein CesoFtcFv8_008234 [Champsocephalus esox]|uniref:Uncharacterized protein n=1 Tax=Champsocephalus esox TaxID=159716 RepID=A0AAN8C7V9_9TELE|nr:hypothetical protein CesoFtcFv8_008234 [Champsocephalus esox]